MSTHSISPAAVPWTSGGIQGLGMTGNQQLAISTVSTAGSILAGTAPLWAGTGTAAASAGSAAAAGGAGTAIAGASLASPIIGVAVAAITLALVAIFSRKGPKQKTESTQIVESVIKNLQDNLAAYQSGPHTVSSQAQALANFDAGWAYLVSADGCGNSELGTPGARCIFERKPVGSCTQAEADAANEPLSDCGKYSMSRDLRDPIANDPNLKPDPTMVDEAGNLLDSITGGLFTDSSAGSSGSSFGWLLLAGGALLLALSIGDGK